MSKIKTDTTQSASYEMPEWIKLTAVYWTFPIARTRAELDLLRSELSNSANFGYKYAPSDSELSDAVRYLAGPDGRQSKCPTLRDLIIAVKVLRKQDRIEHVGSMAGEDLVADIKAAMLRMSDNRQRWDYLCDNAPTLAMCRDLSEWATNRWPSFEDDAIAYKRAMVRRNGSAWREALGAVKSVRDENWCDTLAMAAS